MKKYSSKSPTAVLTRAPVSNYYEDYKIKVLKEIVTKPLCNQDLIFDFTHEFIKE